MSTDHEAPSALWTPVLRADALADGQLRLVRVARHPVVVARRGSHLHALGGICPHDLASLGEARLRGDDIVCPRHGARFRLCDGVCEAGFTLPALPCYPVRLHLGKVEIDRRAVERRPPGPSFKTRWDLTRR